MKKTFFIFFKFYFIFKLYIIVLVLPNIKMNLPQVYMCSASWTLLLPPSPYHPSGSSQCTSPKHPVSCIKKTRFSLPAIWATLPRGCFVSLCSTISVLYFRKSQHWHWDDFKSLIFLSYHHSFSEVSPCVNKRFSSKKKKKEDRDKDILNQWTIASTYFPLISKLHPYRNILYAKRVISLLCFPYMFAIYFAKGSWTFPVGKWIIWFKTSS